jgi:hypothetical protein
LIVIVIAVALVWIFYLDGKLRNRPAPQHYTVHLDAAKVFSEEEMAVVGKEASEDMREIVARSAEQLEASLKATIAGLNTKTEEMASQTLSQEFEKYQASFEALREEMIREFSDLQKQLDERRLQLSADLEDAVRKDREARMDSFNGRIADVVSSYIVETLDKGVDLGAQSAYILHTLEQHKEDIKKDVLS